MQGSSRRKQWSITFIQTAERSFSSRRFFQYWRCFSVFLGAQLLPLNHSRMNPVLNLLNARAKPYYRIAHVHFSSCADRPSRKGLGIYFVCKSTLGPKCRSRRMEVNVGELFLRFSNEMLFGHFIEKVSIVYLGNRHKILHKTVGTWKQCTIVQTHTVPKI